MCYDMCIRYLYCWYNQVSVLNIIKINHLKTFKLTTINSNIKTNNFQQTNTQLQFYFCTRTQLLYNIDFRPNHPRTVAATFDYGRHQVIGNRLVETYLDIRGDYDHWTLAFDSNCLKKDNSEKELQRTTDSTTCLRSFRVCQESRMIIIYVYAIRYYIQNKN